MCGFAVDFMLTGFDVFGVQVMVSAGALILGVLAALYLLTELYEPGFEPISWFHETPSGRAVLRIISGVRRHFPYAEPRSHDYESEFKPQQAVSVWHSVAFDDSAFPVRKIPPAKVVGLHPAGLPERPVPVFVQR